MRFVGRRRDRDLVEEIDTHLSLAEEEYRRAGLSDEGARDAARRAFGGVLKTRQMYREQRRWRWLDTLLQDVRFALRTLGRDRGFAATAVLVLGIGIGVNNMQFTVIYTHTLRSLPIADAGRVLIGSLVDERGADRNVSYAEYQDVLKEGNRFEALGAFGSVSAVALGDTGAAPDRYLGVYTTATAFDLLRIRPILGRAFTHDEEQQGAARVAMLGEVAWRNRYNADPSVIGREVLVDGKPTTIVGIVRDQSGFPSTAEVFLPVTQVPRFSMARDHRIVRVLGRVRDGVSAEEAQAQLRTLLVNAAASSGDTARGLLPSVGPITTRFRGNAGDPAWIAFYAVGFLVIGVACANAANLMLARGARRGREIAIRSSLGASRTRVVFQLLVESVVLAAGGAIAGIAVSMAGVRLFRLGVPETALPYWFRYSMDPIILSALIVVSFATVIVFGLVPALQTSRTDASRVLKDGGWSGSGRRSSRWLTTGFTAAQLALSVVLMSYVVHEFVDEREIVPSDAVIESLDVLTGTITLPADRYATPEQRAAFYTQLQERLRASPGITSATVASSLPKSGAVEQRLQPDGIADRDLWPSVRRVDIGADYFDTLQLPLRRGRDFETRDTSASAIVNEQFAKLFMPTVDPIGQRITLRSPRANEDTATSVTIIGIAPNIRHDTGLPAPLVYLPVSAQPPASMSVLLQSSVDTAATTRQLRETVLGLDQHLPVYQVVTLERALYDVGWNIRVAGRLVGVFSFIVLLLSTVGLYAATAHSVSQRSKEIGIRMAIGARPGQVGRWVLSGAALHVALGLLFGIAATHAWDQAFSSGIAVGDFADPRALIPIVLVLALAMVIACAIPLRHAVKLDPVKTLRQD